MSYSLKQGFVELLKKYHEKIKDLLGKKVDVVEGKGLSTEDFTTAYKTVLDGYEQDKTAMQSYVDTAVANLVNGAPETLDTLKELSDALTESDDAVNSLTTLVGNKVDKVDGKGLSTEDYSADEKAKLAKFTEDTDGKLLYNGTAVAVEATPEQMTEEEITAALTTIFA